MAIALLVVLLTIGILAPWTVLVILPPIVFAGWYRRRTWFRAFSPIARSHIFRPRRSQQVATVELVAIGVLGATLGLVIGFTISVNVTGDPTGDQGSGFVVVATILGAAAGIGIGFRFIGPRLRDK